MVLVIIQADIDMNYPFLKWRIVHNPIQHTTQFNTHLTLVTQ